MDGEGEPVEEPVEELLTAGQALVVVAIVVAIALTYAYRFWKQMETERSRESFLQYDFALPPEKQEFAKVVAMKPEEKPENQAQLRQWHLALCKLLFKRVMTIINLHEKVNNDYRTQMALYKRGVSVYMLPQIEHAKEIVEKEVQECGMTANQLRPNWGTTIFQEAYKMREQMRKREAEEEAKKVAAEEAKLEADALRMLQEQEEAEEKKKREEAEKELLAMDSKEAKKSR